MSKLVHLGRVTRETHGSVISDVTDTTGSSYIGTYAASSAECLDPDARVALYQAAKGTKDHPLAKGVFCFK